MPTRLRVRLFGWSIYGLIVAWMVLQGMLVGIALLVAPGLWFVLKSWVLGSKADQVGLFDYTVSHIWRSSLAVRAFVLVTLLAAALGSIAWIGTAEMRSEAAKPTLTERVTGTASDMAGAARDTAGDVAEATRDTASGWIATVRGWFSRDADHSP